MLPVSKLASRYRVTVADADFTKKMKLSAAFNYFQEIAGLHSQNLGIGFDEIQEKHNAAWVLVKMRVDIARYPVWDEEITVETWPQYPKKYEFDRDYLIKDMGGNIIARAVSVWAIIDINSREIKKAETIAVDYPEFITTRAIECRLGKLKPAGELEMVYERHIGCSDIDMNGHINNSKYVDFIMDCFSLEDLKKYRAQSIQVCYLNEAFAGDTIGLYKCTDNSNEKKIFVEGINLKDKRTIFTASIDICTGL